MLVAHEYLSQGYFPSTSMVSWLSSKIGGINQVSVSKFVTRVVAKGEYSCFEKTRIFRGWLLSVQRVFPTRVYPEYEMSMIFVTHLREMNVTKSSKVEFHRKQILSSYLANENTLKR